MINTKIKSFALMIFDNFLIISIEKTEKEAYSTNYKKDPILKYQLSLTKEYKRRVQLQSYKNSEGKWASSGFPLSSNPPVCCKFCKTCAGRAANPPPKPSFAEPKN